MPETLKKILVAGASGMVGSALVRALKGRNENQIFALGRADVDFLNQKGTLEFLRYHRFDQVYMAAAKVGGIAANSDYPADFIYENLEVQNNLIRSSFDSNVDRLLFLGSSCIYPKYATQPIREECLLSGGLEPTNSSYALAKISGLQMCKDFNRQYGCDYRAVMPTNLYGPNDNFNPRGSHVLPAIIGKMHAGKLSGADEISLWGSGTPRREFLHVDDMAQACIHVMNLDREEYFRSVLPEYQYLNVGTGNDVSIRQLAEVIANIVGYEGEVRFDVSMPDGTPRKLLDVKRVNECGWTAKIGLNEGIERTYNWYLENIGSENFRS